MRSLLKNIIPGDDHENGYADVPGGPCPIRGGQSRTALVDRQAGSGWFLSISAGDLDPDMLPAYLTIMLQ